jgi:hypothetical protein
MLYHSFSRYLLPLCLVACGGKSLTLGGDGASGGADGATRVFVPEQSDAQALAVDETRLYWLTGYASPAFNAGKERPAHVRSCLKTNCAGATIAYDTWPAAGSVFPSFPKDPFSALSVSSGRVYWSRFTPSGSYQLVSCASTGCVGAPAVLTETSSVSSLASDAQAVYWLSWSDKAILTCQVGGCDSPEVFASVTAFETKGLAVDSSFVYWLDTDAELDWAVMRAPKDRSEGPRVLATGLNQPASLALNSRYVSFSSRYSVGQVAYCPLAGCANSPTAVATNQPYPLSIASDEQSIYWLNAPPRASTKTRAVMRANFGDAGAEPTEIDVVSTPELPSPQAIAVDDSFVYWISWGAQDKHLTFPHASIQRVAK